MGKLLLLFFFSCIFLGCKNSNRQSEAKNSIQTFTYSKTTIPHFFEQLIANHYKDFDAIDDSDFKNFCAENNFLETDTLAKRRFYAIKITHLLFTSKSATNGSKGDILAIPYYWHWITPNPRYEIVARKTNQKLNTIKVPKEFAKYKSYADIDRTPYLFLSELLSKEDLYSSAAGEFSTFGWCSEREMAFVALMESFGLHGQVITSGNHSWSELIVPFRKNGTNHLYKFKIDNTFDRLEWQSISSAEEEIWNHQSFPGQGNWYNQKAHDENEIKKISNFLVSTEAMKNIEEKTVAYLKR